ncbi:MAG: MmcQ/YjbR family DNA-binding protein [Chitinophagales bacterium]
MNIEDIREYCLTKKGVSEGFPFDESTLVFKVLGKIFLLTSLDAQELTINLKCEPLRAIELRETYDCVKPGFHMNKKHWNTVQVSGELSDQSIFDLINHSYDLVVKGLPKSKRDQL